MLGCGYTTEVAQVPVVEITLGVKAKRSKELPRPSVMHPPASIAHLQTTEREHFNIARFLKFTKVAFQPN